MVAPSKSFSLIPDADIDPDSPGSTSLFTRIRDSLVHLEEWLGDSFVAAKDHDHDGVNSKLAAATTQLIEHKELAASASSVVFSTGINGDTDFHYQLRWRIKAKFAIGRISEIVFKPNGLAMTGGFNRIHQTLGSVNDTTGGAIWVTDSDMTDGSSAGGVADFIGARTVQAVTRDWVLTALASGDVRVGPSGGLAVCGSRFTGAANFTSLTIDIGASVGGEFDIGSSFTLYRITKA